MIFCKRFRSGVHHLKNSTLSREFHCALYQSAADLPETWDGINANRNFFLQKSYLQCLEKSQKDTLQFRYVIAFKNEKPVMIVNFQISNFSAAVFGAIIQEQLSELQKGKSHLFEHYLGKTRKNNEILMRLVTCGNNFTSGEHAFLSIGLNAKEESLLLKMIISGVSKEEKLRGKISATLIKDFYQKGKNQKIAQTVDQFVPFTVEPNMLIDIPEKVKSLNDYISLFSKKYRNRAKSILQKGNELEYRELSAAEIQANSKRIFELYEAVFNNAKFKLVKLSADYFYLMKASFHNNFRCYGMFYKEKLVGFTSSFIVNENELEAHYIGFDYALNKELEIYQNILYRFIEQSIQNNCSRLNLGRTASEIKSTVGAKACELVCYIKPQNTVSKIVLKPFISFLQPGEWTPRNPFKEENDSVA